METSNKIKNKTTPNETISQETLLDKFQKNLEQVKNSITNVDINRVTGGMM